MISYKVGDKFPLKNLDNFDEGLIFCPQIDGGLQLVLFLEGISKSEQDIFLNNTIKFSLTDILGISIFSVLLSDRVKFNTLIPYRPSSNSLEPIAKFLSEKATILNFNLVERSNSEVKGMRGVTLSSEFTEGLKFRILDLINEETNSVVYNKKGNSILNHYSISEIADMATVSCVAGVIACDICKQPYTKEEIEVGHCFNCGEQDL